MAAKKPAKATKAKKTIAKKADSAKKAAPPRSRRLSQKPSPPEPESSSQARCQADGGTRAEARHQGATSGRYGAREAPSERPRRFQPSPRFQRDP